MENEENEVRYEYYGWSWRAALPFIRRRVILFYDTHLLIQG